MINMNEIDLGLNMAELTPRERGRFLLSEAQKLLVEVLRREIEWADGLELDMIGEEPRSDFLSRQRQELEATKRSAGVVYKRRGHMELLTGFAINFGAVGALRPYSDSNEKSGSEWEMFGNAAKRRGQIAAEVAQKIGFEVLGHGISHAEVVRESETQAGDMLKKETYILQQLGVA